MSRTLMGSLGAILKLGDDRDIEEHAIPGLIFLGTVLVVGLLVEIFAI